MIADPLPATTIGYLAAGADAEVHGTAQQVRDQMDDLCSSLPGPGGAGTDDGTAQQVIAQLGVLCSRLNSPPEQWSGHPEADAAAAYQQHIAEAKREAAKRIQAQVRMMLPRKRYRRQPRYPLRVKSIRAATRIQAVARMWLAQMQRRRRMRDRVAVQKFIAGVVWASYMRILAASQKA